MADKVLYRNKTEIPQGIYDEFKELHFVVPQGTIELDTEIGTKHLHVLEVVPVDKKKSEK